MADLMASSAVPMEATPSTRLAARRVRFMDVGIWMWVVVGRGFGTDSEGCSSMVNATPERD